MKTDTFNITSRLFDISKKYPNKPLFLHPKQMSYRHFCDLTDSYSSGFYQSGIRENTRTIILIKPGINLFAVAIALFRIGAIPVMIDPGMGIKAMVKALSNVHPEAFIGIPKAIFLKYLFPNSLKSIKNWFSTKTSLKKFRKQKYPHYKVAMKNSTDTVAIFFTSGSTGTAKGVVYKNYMLNAQLKLLQDHFKYHQKEIDLCTFPLIGLFSICLGLSIVMADMNMTHPAKMNPKKVVENIRMFDCTYMFCSPMVLHKLANYCLTNKLKLLSLKKIMTAGAPVSPHLLQRSAFILSENAEICTPYGATEALPITDINHRELLELYKQHETFAQGICIGKPLKGINLRIIKVRENEIVNWKDSEICCEGEIGEITVCGDNVTQSYFNNNAVNKLSKIKDNTKSYSWHRTGDLGRMDKRGRVWFYGRKSHRVEIRNKIFYTVTTEAFFNAHPAIERSALVGVVKNGQKIPLICIQPKSGIRKSNQLLAELKELAASNKQTNQINEFLFYKNFPVDPRHNAKIYREKLAKWAQKKLK